LEDQCVVTRCLPDSGVRRGGVHHQDVFLRVMELQVPGRGHLLVVAEDEPGAFDGKAGIAGDSIRIQHDHRCRVGVAPGSDQRDIRSALAPALDELVAGAEREEEREGGQGNDPGHGFLREGDCMNLAGIAARAFAALRWFTGASPRPKGPCARTLGNPAHRGS
jgi:hypothetical protein